ncbi:MAG: oxidoreductase [Pseudomonadaceae bacterium]|nr:oxidoreductase [Pseudomonadaceae bacterium]
MARYSESSVPEQTGKTALITGANTGIGFATARVLAERGARVLVACRSTEKAEDTIARIKQTAPTSDLAAVTLELTSLSSIRQAAQQINQEARLDILVNNAGVMMPPKTLTDDGFELQFGVNHLGHYALTGLVLPVLSKIPGARVVSVSSLAHIDGRIDFNDPQAERSYSAMRRYQMSKMANMLFMLELARRCDREGLDIMSVGCHPGIADTELARTLPGWFSLLAPFIRPFLNTSAEGALPSLMAATSPNASSGDYFGPAGAGERTGSAGPARIGHAAKDPAAAEALWNLSAELTGVTYLANSP